MKNKNFFKISMIYFIAMICVAVIFVLGYLGVLQNDILSSFLIQIVVMFAIPMLMYTLLVSKNFKKTFTDAGFNKISGTMIGISVLLGFVLYFINSFVADVFASLISLFGYESIGTTTTVTLDYAYLLKDFVLSAVLPGFCEEFLHRGILLHAGKKSGNPRYVLIISSILFGLMHLNINQFFYTAILGLLMGYVALISNSIFPSMIIHFMNNFLSSYFVYGYYLNWPFAVAVNNLRAFLMSNVFVFIITCSILVILLVIAYIYLTRWLIKERARRDVKKIIEYLELNSLPINEAQEKINQANILIQQSKMMNLKTNVPGGTKFSFTDNIFVISSFVLGGLITICSFIWGVI